MKRNLCITALFAVVLIPDWASACWPQGGGPVYTRTRYAPVYHGPIYYAVQPVYSQPVYAQPVYLVPGAVPTPMQPPRIVPVRGNSDSSHTIPPRGVTQPDVTSAQPVAAPPENEPVRPAAGADAPKPPKPDPAPTPSEPNRGSTNVPKLPSSDPKLPPLELPKNDPPKLPLEFPPGAGGNPKIPSLDPPKIGADSKLPGLQLPGGTSAVPAPAPAPDALIPSPKLPTPKNPDTLPPLTLPPDTPVVPEKSVEVKSSPITGASGLRVSVFPATGATTATGLRKIGFYNHTKRDLVLTIEGKTVTLPALSYLHAQLPPTFTWKCADKPATKETVPPDASGVDVLIRD